ncbi:DUF6531 domain-containing protein, partial [Luteibacter sp. PPL201]
MKILVALAALVFSTGAIAGQYYYTVDVDGSDPNAIHYTTPVEACHAAYDKDAAAPPPEDGFAVSPYQDPTLSYSMPPKYEAWDCYVEWANPAKSYTYGSHHSINRNGDNCTDDQVYNPMSGYCESSDTEQERKELGDPNSPANVGFVSCGDPVNPANGNVFESETDYVDQDGELHFTRSYNSGGMVAWTTTFDTAVWADRDAQSRGAVVAFEDGRTALFSMKNGQLVPDGDEMGSLTKTATGWTYASAANEVMTFDGQGSLTRWQRADGRALTISQSMNASYQVVRLVTDSLGHQLTYTTYNGLPLSLVVGDLTINYGFDSMFRLTSVKKSWPGHTTTRRYVYEDTSHPQLLTGIVDERGIRVSTWSYDASGRAISATEADGSGRFSFAY